MSASAGKRVLMLLENNPYPQDGRVRREALALTEAGYDVTVVAPRDGSQPFEEEVKGVRVCRYPAPPNGQGLVGYMVEYGWSLAASFAIALRVWLTRGFDIVHAHNPPDLYVLIGGFFKLLGKRFIFDHHDLAPEMYHARFGGRGNPLVHRLLVLFEQLSCRVADHVIATNGSYRDLQIQRGGVDPARISIVRNGPELERVRLLEPNPEVRAKAPTIIGYAGVLGFQDGLDYLLRALHALRHELGRSDFYMVIVGKGDALESLKALAQSLDIADRVLFTGFVSDEDYVRYLSTADLCVVPDPSNPFTDRSTMIKMTEYLALGKPIVAFDLPEHRVTAADAALYVTPNDERAMARAIASLMDDPERRTAMGATGQRRAEQSIAWHHSIPHLLEAYRIVTGIAPALKARLAS